MFHVNPLPSTWNIMCWYSHEIPSLIFSEKNNEMLSAAVVIGALRLSWMDTLAGKAILQYLFCVLFFKGVNWSCKAKNLLYKGQVFLLLKVGSCCQIHHSFVSFILLFFFFNFRWAFITRILLSFTAKFEVKSIRLVILKGFSHYASTTG